jgi:type II secretory pathway predicted ATPase ExeA
MIEFRLKKAGYASGPPFFTDEAIREIHRYTQGYPRRIAMLCHNALKALVMEGKSFVDVNIVRELVTKEIK